MKPQQTLLTSLLALAITLVTNGCGTKTGTGVVNVSFANNTSSRFAMELNAAGFLGFAPQVSLRTLAGVTPDVYQMKLVAMYIVEDIDSNMNNVGALTRIWTSHKCDSDLTYCGIGPAAGSYIVDYFDFAAGTSAVNTTLNSYRRDTAESTVNPGTYRYIRLDFQGATGAQTDTSVENLKFGTSTEYEVRAQRGQADFELPSPMVLQEGETFTIDLAYDLENRFYATGNSSSAPAEVGADDKWTCDGSGASVPCIVEVPFSPTVTKN